MRTKVFWGKCRDLWDGHRAGTHCPSPACSSQHLHPGTSTIPGSWHWGAFPKNLGKHKVLIFLRALLLIGS